MKVKSIIQIFNFVILQNRKLILRTNNNIAIQCMKVFVFVLCTQILNAQSVTINEFDANGNAILYDEDYEFEDWIELYNSGPDAVNLEGWFLSDDADELTKWEFPYTPLGAYEYVTIYASGKNRTSPFLHTNFSIAPDGEEIFLVSPDLLVIDSVASVDFVAGITYGRQPNGTGSLFYLSDATPGYTNNFSDAFTSIAGEPVFNISGGFYTDSLLIELSSPSADVVIHYTTDGSEPTESSPVYTTPLTVKSRIGDPNTISEIPTTANIYWYWLPPWNPPAEETFKSNVIRARCFEEGVLPGNTITNTYFIDDEIFGRYGNLPVVSLATDSMHLFDYYTGIYVPGYYHDLYNYGNYFWKWKIPASVECFQPDGATAFKSMYEVNIHGSTSPDSPQKGLNVDANGIYGDTGIPFPVFQNYTSPAKYITEFRKLIFRAWGSDRQFTLFRDAFNHTMMAKKDFEVMAYQPFVLFINGEYWGLQEFREPIKNGWYYEQHFGYHHDSIDIIEGGYDYAVAGDAVHWNNMINFMNANSLAVDSNYAYIKTQMDVQNFMLYMVHCTYMAKVDWPNQNEGKWRPKTEDGKWRWYQWDMDNSSGFAGWSSYATDRLWVLLNSDGYYGPHNEFVNLAQNIEFRNDFVNLYCDEMNSDFLPGVLNTLLDSMVNAIAPFMEEYQNRWQLNFDWDEQINGLKDFIDNRPPWAMQYLIDNLNLENKAELLLNVNDTAMGYISINTLTLNNTIPRETENVYPWKGNYVTEIPIPLSAYALPGYHFVKWMETGDTSAVINITLTGDTIYTAVFAQDTVITTIENITGANPVFRIFPNPAHTILNVETEKASSKKIIITDAMGKVVLQVDEHKTKLQLHIEHLPAGIYLLEIQHDEGFYAQKFMKE